MMRILSFRKRVKKIERALDSGDGIKSLSDIQLNLRIFDLYKQLAATGELSREEARKGELFFLNGGTLLAP
jgi:hypothetical protein